MAPFRGHGPGLSMAEFVRMASFSYMNICWACTVSSPNLDPFHTEIYAPMIVTHFPFFPCNVVVVYVPCPRGSWYVLVTLDAHKLNVKMALPPTSVG